jgi:pyruvate,orthophosphate dikinase
MHAARGILTTRGGMTSHAAVVARGMGRPCVAGAGGICGRLRRADAVSAGARSVPARSSSRSTAHRRGVRRRGADDRAAMSGDFGTLMEWADEVPPLKVRANAETPLDAETARKFGAEGIGLCRTEHMFFDPERIGAVRQMIMADDEAGRRAALAGCCRSSARISSSCSRIMAGLPVTIRLLDPPLHEFLPHAEPNGRGGAGAGRRRRNDPPRAPNSPKPTRCWAIAAAGWAFPIRKSTRCRRARSSRARSRSPRKPATRPCRRS